MEFPIPDYNDRFWQDGDSVEELNTLLLAAYRPLAEAGMRYAASYEDVEATRRNLAQGECHVAFSGTELVASAMFRRPPPVRPGWKSKGPSWYERAEVASFGRFAVAPAWQGRGVGARMMDRLERRARELGFAELALDTSERADHLIAIYQKRGYRFVQHHQWEHTNYRSVVLSKALGPAA